MYVTYLNLPNLPNSLIDQITAEYIAGQSNNAFPKNDPSFKIMKHIYASITPTDEIKNWCNENICKNLKWFVQVIKYDLPLHKDIGASCKLNYIFQTGGNNVETNFYDDTGNLIYSEIIMPYRWHLLKVDTAHKVCNLEKNSTRLSISGCIF